MDEKEYENICQNCGIAFLTDDEDEAYCPSCWSKVINLENEGSGETIENLS